MADLTTFTDDGAAAPSPAKKQKLSPSASELMAERNGVLPVWVRAPKIGTERFSGLSRAKLYELAGERKIKTASLRKPGQLRGCRLFHLDSILKFIEGNQL